jgi:hypothetical protein
LIESIGNFCAYNEATVLHHREISQKNDHYWLQLSGEKEIASQLAFHLQFVASW